MWLSDRLLKTYTRARIVSMMIRPITNSDHNKMGCANSDHNGIALPFNFNNIEHSKAKIFLIQNILHTFISLYYYGGPIFVWPSV
jgi:hypothetical protein